MRRDTLKTASRFGILSDPAKEMLIGNWQDPGFLEGRKYDTILADYLLGAVDGSVTCSFPTFMVFSNPVYSGLLRTSRIKCSDG